MDRTVRLWDPVKGERLGSLGAGWGGPIGIALMPDGQRLGPTARNVKPPS